MATRAELDAKLAEFKQAIADAAQRVIDKLNSLDPNSEDFAAEIADLTDDLGQLQNIVPGDAVPATPAAFNSEAVTTPNPQTQTAAEAVAGAGSGTLPDLQREAGAPSGIARIVPAGEATDETPAEPVLAEDVKADDNATA